MEPTVSEKAGLLKALKDIDRIGEAAWANSLNDRKRKELEFHDMHRDRSQGRLEDLPQDTYEKFYANKKYYTATGRSKQYVEDWIAEHSPNKVFLDYACGNGFNAISAAKNKAKLAIGIDISPQSVRNARADAKAAGVEGNTFFVQADAEDTKLPANSVDSVICSGMLHHLDLSCALPELKRVLKPGGKILAVEALDYNPFIKLYRNLTPSMRTEWEKSHILSLKDVRYAETLFSVGEIKYWHITSILTPHLERLRGFFDKLDTTLTRIPYVQRMAWIFTFEMTKTPE